MTSTTSRPSSSADGPATPARGWTRSGIEIPAGAVFSPNGATTDETYVWIIDEATRTVSSKSVELISIGDRGLLVNGLEAGDRIVVAGANVLTEGQQVRLQGE